MIEIKEESEKADLKLNIQKTKLMASGLITLWPIEGQKVEAVTDFIFLGSKITWVTAAMNFLGRKAMTNLGSVLKSREITLLTNVRTVNATAFPVVMY